MKARNSFTARTIALILAIIILNQAVLPPLVYGLTSGPKSPEFASFSPVASTDMVNLLTGDFQYSIPVVEIPGPDGGGYALSLNYNSAVNAEMEASWVGFGWSLNPGSINRGTRGIPDDYNGQTIAKYNKSRPNWTVSGTFQIMSFEAYSLDVNLSASAYLRFNNYRGYSQGVGFGLTAKGIGFNLDINQENGPTVTPVVSTGKNLSKSKKKAEDNEQSSTDSKEAKEEGNLKLKAFAEKAKSVYQFLSVSNYGLQTFNLAANTTSFTKYHGFSWNYDASIQINTVPQPIGFQTGLSGNFNVQFNDYYDEKEAYGFYHSGEVRKSFIGSGLDISKDFMMDYYVEKESSYDKRDVYIGMPFSNYDNFSVTGEGVSGAFRAFPNRVGCFRPNKGFSTMVLDSRGVEIMFGPNIGMGCDLGAGLKETWIEDWASNDVYSEDMHFRFNNDMGGSIDYTKGNTEPSSTHLKALGVVPRATDLIPFDLMAKGEVGPLEDARQKRASYIQEWTLSELSSEDMYSNYSENIPGNAIVKFSITNENGVTYNYGQPVFVKNETNLNIDIDKYAEGTSLGEDNYIAFKKLPLSLNGENRYELNADALRSEDLKVVIGEVKCDEYAAIYLLTSIVGPDFIDVDADGFPSEADFGAWTRFNYQKVYGYGSDEGWYRFRTPYNGLIYNPGEISNTRDDMGSVYTGQKEIFYLESVETKSHIAWFVTNQYENNSIYLFDNGSGIDRTDGLSAPEIQSNGDISSHDNLAKGSKKLRKLERIELFSKSRPKQPLKTIHFQYDNSLVQGLSNSCGEAETGKLTLKKLWFEYEGVEPLKISPYEFVYSYKASSDFNVDNNYIRYLETTDEFSVNEENPEYSPYTLDPWGNIMAYGKQLKSVYRPWVYQGKMPAAKTNSNPNDWKSKIKDGQLFDPAAWALKQIHLPSGGEIHVQYEEKDYRYVQNRNPMSMVSLMPESDNDRGDFILNLVDLGIDPKDKDLVDKLVETIKQTYNGSKTYFKFLYILDYGSPSLDNNISEYITGYSTFGNAWAEDDDNDGNYAVHIMLGNNSKPNDLPKELCLHNLITSKQGLVGNKNEAPRYIERYEQTLYGAADNLQNDLPGSEGSPVLDYLKAKSSVFWKVAVPLMGDFGSKDFVPNHRVTTIGKPMINAYACTMLEPALSYIKIPMIKAKRGGGTRVKQVVLYDEGINNGHPVLYGNRYHYVLPDGVTSSGVASNEPNAAREENPLITFMPKKKQGIFNKLFTGKDWEQTEGPAGESILPAANVVHSRVVVENIHTGKTGTGFSVSEYFTTKDYPFDHSYGSKSSAQGEASNLQNMDVTGKGHAKTELDYSPSLLNLPIPNFSLSKQEVWMAQGFRFVINSMNGKPKSNAVYGGTYNSDAQGDDTQGAYLVSKTDYRYFEPGEKVPLLVWNGNNYDIQLSVPGKEVDLAIEGKKHMDVSTDFSIEFDPSITLGTFTPQLSLMPSFAFHSTLLATHSNTKVISYPAILKKTVTLQEGMYSEQEHIAFDGATGKPLVTKSTDSYYGLENANGFKRHTAYYTFNVPAHWIYENMGQKAKNSGNSNQLGSSFMNIVTYTDEYNIGSNSDWVTKSDNDVSLADIDNVISIGIQTFSDSWGESWDDSKILNRYAGTIRARNDLNSIMRPRSSYSYVRDNVLPQNNDGTFNVASAVFNLSGTQQTSDWLRGSTITKYSPNGNPLEEQNAQGIYSSVLYDESRKFIVPSMIAANAQYTNIYYSSFEGKSERSNSYYAHSGRRSAIFKSGTNILGENITITDHLLDKGGTLSFWIYGDILDILRVGSSSGGGGTAFPFEQIAKVGEWSLVKVDLSPESLHDAYNKNDILDIYLSSGSKAVAIDDIKFLPKDAQGTCFVYDDALRLVAQFDDQHFGTYFQYDEEGKLVRKSIETERGIRTLQETEYNTPKKEKGQ